MVIGDLPGNGRFSTRDTASFHDHLITAIDCATTRVWLRVPWWRSDERPGPLGLLRAVIAAAERGCDVKVILRNEPSNTRTISVLTEGGASVRCVRYLHEKELIADDRLITFSANFTQKELQRNINSGYELDSDELRLAAEGAFVALWGADPADRAQGDEVWTAAANVVPGPLLPYLQRDTLNPLQAKALPIVFGTDGHLIVVAPTGAGKTDIGEAAVLRSIVLEGRRAVYLTPARALTGELGAKFARWEAHGLRICRLTGEEDVDTAQVRAANLWVATTEKFESVYRRSSLAMAVAEVGCIVVDEIHLVGDQERGPTLEALLARLRLIAAQTRIVGLSATVDNAQELGQWLGAAVIESTWRPVQLTVQVLSYETEGTWSQVEQKKDQLMLPIVNGVLEDDDPGQVLVFCGSKFAARRVARVLAGSECDVDDAEALARDCASRGVGLHYRGLTDLKEVAADFREGQLRVLVATSGLAQGVNLPARVVVVRDTKLGQTPLSTGDALQMLGRAGRAGLEDEGYGFLFVGQAEARTWRERLREGHRVDSRLLASLPDHILADVLLGRIASAGDLHSWFQGTFAYHQTRAETTALDEALEELLTGGFVAEEHEDNSLSCTELGKLTSRLHIDVASATAIIESFANEPAPDGPITAEAAVLRNVALGAKRLREEPVAAKASEEVWALLRAGGYEEPSPDVPAGVGKTLLAAQLALWHPSALGRKNAIGPFSTVELRDLANDVSRFLAWLGALGSATSLGWPVAVASDLAARIEWRTAQPARGHGRLLRLLDLAVPADERRNRVPQVFHRYLSMGCGTPEAVAAAKSAAAPAADEYSGGLRARELRITSARSIEGRLLIDIEGPTSGCHLMVRVHAGGEPTLVDLHRWGGAQVTIHLPRGAHRGRIAVDVLGFGQNDWGYVGGVYDVEASPSDEYAYALELIESLSSEVVVSQRVGVLGSLFSSARRQWRQRVLAILQTEHPVIRELAAQLAGHGSLELRCWSLRAGLDALLADRGPSDALPRLPSTVLKTGHATPSERGLVLAVLLGHLGHDVGLAQRTDSGTLLALVKAEDRYLVVARPDELGDGELDALVPAHRGVLAAVPPPPATSPTPIECRLTFLEAFRRPQTDTDRHRSQSA